MSADAEIEDLVAQALSDLLTDVEDGPQPLLPSDPACPCERGPFDLRHRGVQRVPVRLDMACPRHFPNPPISVRVEITRTPSPKENP